MKNGPNATQSWVRTDNPVVTAKDQLIHRYDPVTGAPLLPTALYDPYTGKRLTTPGRKPEVHVVPSPTPSGTDRTVKRKSDTGSSAQLPDKEQGNSNASSDEDDPSVERKRRSNGDG